MKMAWKLETARTFLGALILVCGQNASATPWEWIWNQAATYYDPQRARTYGDFNSTSGWNQPGSPPFCETTITCAVVPVDISIRDSSAQSGDVSGIVYVATGQFAQASNFFTDFPFRMSAGGLVVSASASFQGLSMGGGELTIKANPAQSSIDVRFLGVGGGQTEYVDIGSNLSPYQTFNNGKITTNGREMTSYIANFGLGRFEMNGRFSTTYSSFVGTSLTSNAPVSGRLMLLPAPPIPGASIPADRVNHSATVLELERITLENHSNMSITRGLGLTFGGVLENFGTLTFIPRDGESDIGFYKVIGDGNGLTQFRVPGLMSGALRNRSGGTIVFEANSGFQLHRVNDIVFNNDGVVSVSFSGTTVEFSNVTGDHTGAIGTVFDYGRISFVGGSHRFTGQGSGIIAQSIGHSGGLLEGGNHRWGAAFMQGGIQSGAGTTELRGEYFSFHSISNYRFDHQRLVTNSGTLTIAGTLTFADGAVLQNYATLGIANGAAIGFDGGAPGRLENFGTVALRPNSQASINRLEMFNAAGASFTIPAGTGLTMTGNVVRNSGRFVVAANGTLELNGASFNNIANLSGSSRGNLQVLGKVMGDGTFTNHGDIVVGTDGILAAQSMRHAGGTLTVDGTLDMYEGTLSMTGGVLNGNGRINGNAFVGGGSDTALFKPGHSPGSMTITGELRMGNRGVLELEIERDNNGVLHWDTVTAGTMVFEQGSLIRVLIAPTAAGSNILGLNPLVCSVGSCNFSQASVAVVGGSISGLMFSPSGLIFGIAPVPEPTTYVMLLAGLLTIGTIACRRRSA